MEDAVEDDDVDGEDDLEEDEEEEEEEEGSARCPICDEENECDHVFARLDRSNGCCEGGVCYSRWGELLGAVRKAFHPLLAGRAQGVTWKWEYVEELWSCALDNFKEGDAQEDTSVDPYVLIRMLTDLLRDRGLEERDDDSEGGGPGQSTATRVFYSESPESVFDDVLEAVRSRLVPATPKPQRRKAAAKPTA